MERAVLETKHQAAFRDASFFCDLREFALPDDISGCRSYEEKPVGQPFRKTNSHRCRGRGVRHNRHARKKGKNDTKVCQPLSPVSHRYPPAVWTVIHSVTPPAAGGLRYVRQTPSTCP